VTAGITSFQPWPATRRIAVAADRDEARSPDDHGYRAGETAARSLALAHHHLGHELVGVQAALHQGFCLAATDDLDRRRGGMTVRHISQAIWPDVQAELPGHRANLGLRSNQDRPDQVGPQPPRPPQ
jgi:hypothetical protein